MDKKHILQEIRRTAKENGGTPLGVRMFYRETGIKEADWKGKIWVRWGDALREAGFEPNVLTTAYDESFLLKKYIELTRELGHLPVEAELRLKTRKDPDFPSSDSFKRWGIKSDLVARLIEYCKTQTNHEDVLGYCNQYASPTKQHSNNTKSQEQVIGYVYLIKFGRHYKIGRSNSFGRRERELAIQLPEKTRLVHAIKTDDPVGIEAYWHKRFESKRRNGEWFELDSTDLTAFKRRKFM